ncbi:hypothetical protein [Vibrio renipiscarius]|uniref:Uncharacterized protein n=1 Tax=Vibrio renipiscarius TaxID=1461322 RepID=A0A0C2JEQ7_9VIBR|nr:hypothetical protein [Vibrio renipiscarius]KII76399.1 hypothetical protein OJ16_16530 [Vibrio renipiscarius]KII78079.1 hypothetical protein PL18_14040 [Vibrio renipiscarius]
MFRTCLLVGLLSGAFIGSAHSASFQLNQLEPLPERELSGYRGGFKFNDDFMINIGLSIRTSVNGDTLFTNRIANLMIQNGRLISRLQREVPTTTTTVVQVGSDNTVGLPTTPVEITPTSEPNAPSRAAPSGVASSGNTSDVNASNGNTPVIDSTPIAPQQVVESPVEILPLVNVGQVPNVQSGVDQVSNHQAVISSIIQNSLDNTVLGFDTVINIDAQVGSVIKQIERNTKLQQALQFSFQ